MFKPTLGLWQAAALTTDLLRAHLPQRWFGELARPHIGLAISGGVDSMALATLCSKLRDEQYGEALSFTAFIVDHGLRSGSDEEALKVAKHLEQLNISSKILTLDRRQYGDAHANKTVESIARRLRYRALGRVCRGQGIANLLFAHHADDQAETTLMRIANNYLGKGLGGIKQEARIPECEDIYGVHDSGSPRLLRRERLLPKAEAHGAGMLIEGGSITILRPLLQFTKDRLVATCKEAGVRWVEDETNKDPSLTLRNTVRQLHERNIMPVALRRPNLCAIATRTSRLATEREAKADDIFRRLDIKIDPRSGHATCRIPYDTAKGITQLADGHHVKAVLLRKLLQVIVPANNVNLTTLDKAASEFLAIDSKQSSTSKAAPISLAKATAVRLRNSQDGFVYELRRTPPPRGEDGRSNVEISLPLRARQERAENILWSDWHFWDGRYWIRVGGRPSRHAQSMNVVVRMLTPDDVDVLRSELRGKLRGEPAKESLQRRLDDVKGHFRITLPAIVQSSADKDGLTKHRVVALPSLGWCQGEWFPKDLQGNRAARYFYEIRYRHVDDSLTEPVGTAPVVKIWK